MSWPDDEFPPWATDGAADVDVPPDSRIELGWVAGIKPPAGYVNWFWNLVSDAFAHLRGSSARFDTLHAFIDATTEGQTGIVAEWDGNTAIGVPITTVTPAGGATLLAANGRYVCVVSGANDVKVYDRDLTTLVVTITMAGTVRAIAVDGIYIAIAEGNNVAYHIIATGVQVWTYNHASNVYGVCCANSRVFMCGQTAGSMQVRALNATSGALIWSYRHSGTAATVFSIATDGMRVFIGGAASSYGSGATLRCIVASNGSDIAGEGGLGTDTSGYSWDVAATPFGADDGCLATDGRLLLVGQPAAAASQVAVCDLVTGAATSLTGASTLGAPVQCAIDGDLLVVVGENGSLGVAEFFDKRTLRRIHSFLDGNDFDGVASDGARLYVTVNGVLRRISRGTTRPRVWRRADATRPDNFAPYRWLATPEE